VTAVVSNTVANATKAKLKVSVLATPAAHWFTAVAPVSVSVPKGATPRPSVAVSPRAAKTLYVGSLRVGVS
jgi:hypothetical protein